MADSTEESTLTAFVSSVFLMEGADARIARGVFVADRAAFVGRSVVHEQKLKVAVRLPQHRLDAGDEPAPRVIDRDEDGKEGRNVHGAV